MTSPPIARPARKIVWHPLAFALQPIAALYATNAQIASLADVWRAIAIILATTCILWAALTVITRRSEKAALVVSLFLFAFFFWGHFLDRFIPPDQIFHKTRFFIAYVVFFSIPGIAFFFLKSTQSLSRLFHVFGGVLLALPVATLLLSGAATASPALAMRTIDQDSAWEQATLPPSQQRDIFVLLLDGYPRDSVLRDDYHIDNSTFLDGLRARGFHVTDDSYSNYNKTLWSLGSALNGAYLQDLLPTIDPTSSDLRPLLNVFRQNRVFRFFSRQGYSLYAFETGFELADLRVSVDHFLAPHGWGNEFEALVLQMTPIPAMYSKIAGSDFLYDQHRKRIRFVRDTFKEMASHPSATPRFVWTHMVIPHDPIIFGPNGESRQIQSRFIWGDAPPAHLSWNEYTSIYGDQLVYLHAMVLDMLDTLLQSAAEPPLIVVMSDHGPHNLPHKQCAASFKNLCAIYTPPDISWMPPVPMDLVNLFPSVINMLMDSEEPIPLSTETRLYRVNWEQPYQPALCEEP